MTDFVCKSIRVQMFGLRNEGEKMNKWKMNKLFKRMTLNGDVNLCMYRFPEPAVQHTVQILKS